MSESEDTNLIEYKDNPLGLFESLLKIRRKEIQDNNKRTTKIIIELNKKHGLDLCELALRAMEDGFNCFYARRILEGAIPFLNLNVISTFEYLKKLHNSMETGDLAAGILYRMIANLTDKQPKFARELLDILIDSGEPFIIGYISTIFEIFAKAGIEDIHHELLTLLSHRKDPVVQGAIFALGNLQYDVEVDKDLIKKTLAAFDELLERKSDAIDLAIASSLGVLHYLGVETRSRLMALAKRNEHKLDSLFSSTLSKMTEINRFFDTLITKYLNHDNYKLHKEAQKGSIVSQITTKIPLKYGKRWFNYRDGKYCEPSSLSSFSHSVEIPVSEIYNPVSASIKRTNFRIIKRGKQ